MDKRITIAITANKFDIYVEYRGNAHRRSMEKTLTGTKSTDSHNFDDLPPELLEELESLYSYHLMIALGNI